MTLHHIKRLRHESRRRTLTITAIEQITPSMMRFRFFSPDLGDFISASPDDHIKVLFPEPGTPDGERSTMRDFTPRWFDQENGIFVIDFAMHDGGPAMRWARNAQLGDTLQVGGPRGSAVVPDDFDWYWLIGDETALPSIGRRVEEMRRGIPVSTFVIVPAEVSILTLVTEAAWSPNWIVRDCRSDGELFIAALTGFAPPPGDGFVWIAAEAMAAQTIKTYIIDTLGHPREWVKASGYWTRGRSDTHTKIEG